MFYNEVPTWSSHKTWCTRYRSPTLTCVSPMSSVVKSACTPCLVYFAWRTPPCLMSACHWSLGCFHALTNLDWLLTLCRSCIIQKLGRNRFSWTLEGDVIFPICTNCIIRLSMITTRLPTWLPRRRLSSRLRCLSFCEETNQKVDARSVSMPAVDTQPRKVTYEVDIISNCRRW